MYFKLNMIMKYRFSCHLQACICSTGLSSKNSFTTICSSQKLINHPHQKKSHFTFNVKLLNRIYIIIHNNVRGFTFSRMKFQEPDFDSINWTKKYNHCENYLDFLSEAYNDTDMRLLLFTV